MVLTVHLVLLILAFLCFVFTAFGIPSRVNLTALGLAFWVLSAIVAR